MPIKVPQSGYLEAFAMIVDINSFTPMVKKADGEPIAQFIRDVLGGSVTAVEKNNGDVVGFIGDALLAIFVDPNDIFQSCISIAYDVDKQCEYISNLQDETPEIFSFSQGGPSLKISIEHGWMDVSDIHSNFLGSQRLFIGSPINYASRISSFGSGNRCLLGPNAASKMPIDSTHLSDKIIVPGKEGEGDYICYQWDLGDIWREGKREPGEETYWG